jgi:hypothetical protein
VRATGRGMVIPRRSRVMVMVAGIGCSWVARPA